MQPQLKRSQGCKMRCTAFMRMMAPFFDILDMVGLNSGLIGGVDRDWSEIGGDAQKAMMGVRHNDFFEPTQGDGELPVNGGREIGGRAGTRHRSGEQSPASRPSEGNTRTIPG